MSSPDGIVELGLSEYVVKALVVRAGSLSPFLIGFAAVEVDAGVASLLTVWVWPLCKAGLDHGSSSRFSKESFLIRRDLGGELSGVVCLDNELGACCFEGFSLGFPEELADVICFMKGIDGSGRSRIAPFSMNRSVHYSVLLTSPSLVHRVQRSLFAFLGQPD